MSMLISIQNYPYIAKIHKKMTKIGYHYSKLKKGHLPFAIKKK